MSAGALARLRQGTSWISGLRWKTFNVLVDQQSALMPEHYAREVEIELFRLTCPVGDVSEGGTRTLYWARPWLARWRAPRYLHSLPAALSLLDCVVATPMVQTSRSQIIVAALRRLTSLTEELPWNGEGDPPALPMLGVALNARPTPLDRYLAVVLVLEMLDTLCNLEA